ncbi:hypothetical protein Ocin01_05716 [Orchesella cincta]|uniref:Uncharacterized protein n=1 Tax=Orchesella cincta TaxID=48709 RepID=A0A1D2N7C0_ORCCI|nr:hypothetical protein Ocin01_05716 [Orchesella cincta]
MLKLIASNCTQKLKLHFYWIWIRHVLISVSKPIWNTTKGIIKLEPITVPVPQLQPVKPLVRFIISEIIISFRSALLVTVAWMSLYLNISIVLPILTSLVILSYTARRWYTYSVNPNQTGLTQRLLSLRVAKMLVSCLCTIFCLVTFLIISIQSQTICSSSFFSNLVSSKLKDCPCVKDFLPPPADLKELGKLISYHQARVSRIFLFALESVVLTDAASNVIRMSANNEFRIAMNFEGPKLLNCTFRIVLGAWVFNTLNGVHDSLFYETLLVLLVSAWTFASLIDICYFKKENDTGRTIDFSGYRYMKDITWFQIDVDIVAFIISILLYSQWRTAPSIVYPDEIPLSHPVLPDRVHQAMVQLFAVVTNEFDWEFDSFQVDPELRSETQNFEFAAEGVLVLFVLMTSLRFQSNFKMLFTYITTLQTTDWTPPLIPAEQRHDRRHYRRDLPFHWADNPDADIGDIQIVGVAEVVGN